MITHVKPRKIWTFVNDDVDLEAEEREHLIKCEACWTVFQILLNKLKAAPPPAKSSNETDSNANKQSA